MGTGFFSDYFKMLKDASVPSNRVARKVAGIALAAICLLVYYRHAVRDFGLWEPFFVTVALSFLIAVVLGVFGGIGSAAFYEAFLKKVGASNPNPSLVVFFGEWLFAATSPLLRASRSGGRLPQTLEPIGRFRVMIKNDKKRFICYELGLLSLKGALSTRDSAVPVYAKGIKSHQRREEKKALREILEELERLYSKGSCTEQGHISFIAKTADEVSKKLGARLHNSRFRIGIAQKLINLHLKYLWAAGFIDQPPHCPIDGIIRDKAKINYDWTTSDSIDNYKQAIADLRKVAGSKPLPIWELEEFRRRG